MSDIEDAIEKLKMKKIELVNRANMTTEFDEKEDIKVQIDQIDKQIGTLERFHKH